MLAYRSDLSKVLIKMFGIATGCFWRYNKSKNRDALIKYVAATGVSGIELTFYGVSSIRKFSLSDCNKKFLQSLDFISIHAPDLRRIKNDKNEILKVFSELECLSNSIGADYVVFHVDSIKDFRQLQDFSFKASIENIEKKESKSVTKLLEILDENPGLFLCLDMAHAYSFSTDLAGYFIGHLGDRISHVHLSGSDGVKSHLSFKESDEQFMVSLKHLKDLKAPIILEEDFMLRDMNFIMDEIEMAKKICIFD